MEHYTTIEQAEKIKKKLKNLDFVKVKEIIYKYEEGRRDLVLFKLKILNFKKLAQFLKRRRFVFFFILSFFSCTKKQYIPNNQIIINPIYQDSLNDISPCPSYHLSLHYINIDGSTYVNHLIGEEQNKPYLFNTQKGLNFGRWVISLEYDTLNAQQDIIYKGGDLQLNILLQY